MSNVSYCYQFLLLVKVKHVPHFCLYTTGEETFAIYNFFKESALHCIDKIQIFKYFKGLWGFSA